MNSVIALFCLSLLLTLAFTPIVSWAALRLGIVDMPSARKVHKEQIPRAGGVAIFLGFLLPFGGAFFFYTDLLSQVLENESLVWLIGGAAIVMIMGLIDDIRSVRARVKLVVQILAALVACKGGVMISGITSVMGTPYILAPWFSYIITVFWFLLLINAVNLIDGLDGLAAGICFFASLVLLALSVIGERYFVAMGFAALAGACLGFLRYNFNPASIFLGDSGSYFLGYMLAGLSILGSMKGQAAVAIIIPIVAFGIPIFDTLSAPLRRFILGKKIFDPDRGHIHHELLRMGLDHRHAVLLLYGFSIVLGAFALILVNIHDARAALILAVLWVLIFFGIRKLSYMEYLTMDKFIGWLRDLTDVAGISQKRRSFLSLQLEINKVRSMEDLWEKVSEAVEILKFDRAELRMSRANPGSVGDGSSMGVYEERRSPASGASKDDCRPFQYAMLAENDLMWIWTRGHYRRLSDIARNDFLTIDLPLMNGDHIYLGNLRLMKDLRREPIEYYTLRRVEHLRRSITGVLKWMDVKPPYRAG